MVDVCNASAEADATSSRTAKTSQSTASALGNFNQKKYPENPINYMLDRGIDSIHRFILTHPDMDHMDGIRALFAVFAPTNFWDSDNNCEKEFEEGGRYKEEDWKFYKKLRDEGSGSDPKRLCLFSGGKGHYYNDPKKEGSGHDGLHILAPTKRLLADANASGEHNDASYVLLYRSKGGRILLAGDSHDSSWEHVLKKHADDIKDVDILIAPHHGRDSERDYAFLDVVNPTITFFGNARSEHLAYDAWNSRDLPFITNNQAGSMIVDTSTKPMSLYVTNRVFAERFYSETFFSDEFGGYYIGDIAR